MAGWSGQSDLRAAPANAGGDCRGGAAMTRPDMNRYEDAWTAEVYDYEQADGWGERDVPFYLDLAAEFPGPTLELACGTGRVTLPLARNGVEITGLDISPNMLAVAARKLAAEPREVRERVRLVPGDMSAFNLGARFPLIVIPFRAFQAMLTREEHRGCLRCCREHLRPDGRLAINVFNPRLSRLAQGAAEGSAARSVSLSWGAREVGSPCEWRGRARHCSRAMVGCRGPAPADPGYSKERRRRRRSGNHCLIKCSLRI